MACVMEQIHCDHKVVCFSTTRRRANFVAMHTLPQMSKIRAYLGQQLWNPRSAKKYFLLPFYNFIFHVIKQQTIPQWPWLNPETLSIFRVSGLYGTPEKTEHLSENTADWTNYITNLLFNWHDISIKTIYRTVIIATIHLGSVLRMSLTQLARFDCCRFSLILDHLVLRSSSWTCCHSNRSLNLNLLGSRFISCKQD